jgi:hypothetical protein
VVDGLRQNLWTIADAHRNVTAGGVPDDPGIYAWWMSRVLEPILPPRCWPRIGTAASPSIARSSAIRQSLAALLLEDQGWITRWSGSRAQLIYEHNRALSQWQRDHLRLAWVERARPWSVEASVIALIEPPLNLAGNTAHPLYAELKALRGRLRTGAT